MFDEKRYEFTIGEAKGFFSSGLLARRSESAVLAGLGDTVVLATVNTRPAKSDQPFFPLMVDYMEKMYAGGKISGSRYVKRDRFPSDDAVLRSRMIDRSFRPVFPSDYRDEVQIIVKVLSFDPEFDPVILGINAVSAALQISSAPLETAVSGVRVGLVGDQPFPFYKHVEDENLGDSKMNLVIAGDGEKLTNIDANSFEIAEETVIDAMEFGLEMMKPWLEAQTKFVAMFGEIEKAEYEKFAPAEDLITLVNDKFGDAIKADLSSDSFFEDMMVTVDAIKAETDEYSKDSIKEAYEKVAKKVMRKLVLEEGKRADGREFTQLRELDSKVGILPTPHGTGLFTRGMTQVLTTATLGTLRDAQQVDEMTGEGTRRYMHFYIEEPFSLGETGKVSYIPGRRAVGHGGLAEKALYPVLPTVDDFPYTMVLFSEIMSEMGSSSMGSISGSTLALMDAGVPITKPVAGIAVGIIYEEDLSKYQLITDMVAVEDFYGGMDFKVGGTKDGVTAIQYDTKTKGLPVSVFKEAIMQAKDGRMEVLAVMAKAIETPREQLAKSAPKVEKVKIPESKIGELIGPGGKNIREIQETTGADFDIQEDGTVYIYATDQDMMDKAKGEVEGFAFVPEVGSVMEGTVTGLKDFGAFVEIARGTEGLVHVSEITNDFVKNVEDHVKVGDKVTVKIIGVENGKIKLSMKRVK